MPAYVIADVKVTDPQTYDEYRKHVAATVERYGGRFVVRGGALEVLEGDQPWHRIVVLEFPDMAKLKAWHSSAEYAPLLAMRQRASVSSLVAVEGCA